MLTERAKKVWGGCRLVGLTFAVVLLMTLVPVLVVQGAEWIILSEGTEEGVPPVVEVLEHDTEHTLIHVEIPGFYVEDIYEEGMWFKRVWCDEYGTTNYIGRPELPVLRELLAIPGGVDVDVKCQNIQTKYFEEYNIYPLQPKYPYEYEGPFDFYYDEEFYQKGEYYPHEPAEVGYLGYMKDFYTLIDIINPFQIIPEYERLAVNYEYDVLYEYEDKEKTPMFVGGGADSFTAVVSPGYTNFYANTLANYNFLNIISDNTTGNGYLIITTNYYYNSEEYQDLVDMLTDQGFTLYHKHYPGFLPLDWEDVYHDIRDEWLNTGEGFDYCLIIGDHDDIPPADNIPGSLGYIGNSDYTYQCLKTRFESSGETNPWDDWLPEINVGRISVNKTEELNVYLSKLMLYNTTSGPGMLPWENRMMFISHKQKEPTENKSYISDPYNIREWYPVNEGMTIYRIWGDSTGLIPPPGPTNQDVIDRKDLGVALVNYLGHGGPDEWRSWSKFENEPFGEDEIRRLENTVYPLVFNCACNTGNIEFEGGDCLCEVWLSATNDTTGYYVGAVGVIGCSGNVLGFAARTLDEYIYEGIFDPTNPPPDYEPIFGVIVNQATVKYTITYGRPGDNELDPAHKFPRSRYPSCGPWHFYIFGDPAMVIRVNTNYDDMSTILSTEGLFEGAGGSSTLVIESIYPNPSTSEMLNISIKIDIERDIEISIYDIAGRLVHSKRCNTEKGDNLISINTSDFTSGIYILNISSEGMNDTSDKFVLLK